MTAETILKVKDLQTWFDTEAGMLRAVDGVSFDVRRGETLAILGESGCGKSITALSLMRLVPQPAGKIRDGSVMLQDEEILKLPEAAVRRIRGKKIAMIFQEPQTSLNPVMTIGQQILEVISNGANGNDKRDEAINLLDAVGISDAARRFGEYPHQLSGGMKQRAMIAIALASRPEILIADEPTTALDVTIQAQILSLLKKIQGETGMSVLLITHDLGVVSQLADRVMVMYAGEVVEQAEREEFFANPRHPYSQRLFQSLPGRSRRGTPLAVIEGTVPNLTRHFSGCRFADRCPIVQPHCHEQLPPWQEIGIAGKGPERNHGVRCHFTDEKLKTAEGEAISAAEVSEATAEPVLLEVRDLAVHFPIQRGLFRRTVGYVKAVDGISMDIRKGQTVALVGESGCGKTTVGKGILQLIRPTAGEVRYEGEVLNNLPPSRLRNLRAHLQVMFQDPYGSLNPRMLVGNIVEEGMQALGLEESAAARQRHIAELLDKVGLPPEAAYRYPHEFSGGQRQRISMARALAVDPRLIVCDEPTSALDVSVQAQILNLLQGLQRERGFSYLFITHDIAVVEYLAHEVAVMYLGRIVEYGSAAQVLDTPKHPYTQALLAAVPVIEQGAGGRKLIFLEGDIPSPSHPPAGCHFHPRCAHATEACKSVYPEEIVLEEGHRVSCHLFKGADR